MRKCFRFRGCVSFILLAAMLLSLPGCGQGGKKDSDALSNTLPQNAQDENHGSAGNRDGIGSNGDSTVKTAGIQNHFSSLLGNNPNHFSMGYPLTCDEDYIYCILFKPGIETDTPKLCQMRPDGSEYQVILETGELNPICVRGGFFYYSVYNRIGRIDLSTLVDEKAVIEIPIAEDIQRGHATYEAYSTITSAYCIGNMLVYSYMKGYSGTSSNEQTVQALYNMQTGQVTELALDFVISRDAAFDGDNLYLYADNSVIRIMALSELSDGNTNPSYKEVGIQDGKTVHYAASNGLVVEHKDGSIAFYRFEDCEGLQNNDVWQSETELPAGELFEHGRLLLLTDSTGVSFTNSTKTVEIFGAGYQKKDEVLLDNFILCDVAGDKAYLMGYNTQDQLLCVVIGTDGSTSTVLLEEQEPEPEKGESHIPEQYVDLKNEIYDSGVGLTIQFDGYSNGSTSTISLKLTNDTGFDLNLELDGGLWINGRAEIAAEVVYGLTGGNNGGLLRHGESITKIQYKRSDVTAAGEDSFSVNSVFFKLHFTAADGAERFEYTTGDLAVIQK